MNTLLVYEAPPPGSPNGGTVRRGAPAELPALLARQDVTIWVDLCAPDEGGADEALLRDVFHFHPFAIDDTFAAREQPKVVAYGAPDGCPTGAHLYIITHGLLAGSTPDAAESLELDAFLGRNFLVTHHTARSRSVAAVTDAVLRDPSGGPMHRGPARLLHAILDAQIEGITEVIEGMEPRLDELESRVFQEPQRFDLEGLLALKRTMLKLRRFMGRQRDVVLRIGRQEFGLVSEADSLLFRDLQDQLTRLVDLLENYREMAISILDVYLALTNNRLNETMKFLTVFTAVLMPMTVITGIYGMNFEHMPELQAKWGYPAVLGTMAVTCWLVVRFFRRRGMIGNPAPTPEEAPRVSAALRRTGDRPTAGSTPARSP